MTTYTIKHRTNRDGSDVWLVVFGHLVCAYCASEAQAQKWIANA